MVSPWTYYWLSVLVLAALLFLPVTRMIWALSVRRVERRLGRALPESDLHGQLNRARLLAAVVCSVFSALFNYSILGMAAHG